MIIPTSTELFCTQAPWLNQIMTTIKNSSEIGKKSMPKKKEERKKNVKRKLNPSSRNERKKSRSVMIT